MTDVVSQLEAVLAGIEGRVPHADVCEYSGCECDHARRVRSEIARTVERMVSAALYAQRKRDNRTRGALDFIADWDREGWAAAFRATQEQETP